MYELQGGENLGESADQLLCDHSYNVRRQKDLQISDHDLFNARDMDAFSDFEEYVQKRVGNGHIFCVAVQSASWWR